MITHKSVWNAIDRLAKRHGYSPSGLARRAGLDATSFNKSKRVGPGGKPRWPTMESIARILTATGDTMETFLQLMEGKRLGPKRRMPMLESKQVSGSGNFDAEGYPAGSGWNQASLPDLGADDLFALRISDDQMAPLLRKGDIIVAAPNADFKSGDRVVVKFADGEAGIRELSQYNNRQATLQPLGRSGRARTIKAGDVAWMARIVWISQ